MKRLDWTRGYRGACIAGAAFLVVLFVWLYRAPMLLSHQGIQSLLTAQSLNAGRGFMVTSEIPFAKFGPLYPLCLAFLGRLGFGITPSVYLINCASFAGALLGLFALCRSLNLRRPVVVVALYAVLGANYYLVRSARPDLLFVCAATLTLAALASYVQRRTLTTLLLAAVFASIAATGRYMAVLALLPMILVALWLVDGSWRNRFRDLTIFGLVAAGPVLLWIARNYRVTGFLSGMSRTKVRHFGRGELGFGEQLEGLISTVWIDLFSPDAIGLIPAIYGNQGINYEAAVIVAGLLASAALSVVVWSRRRQILTFFSGQKHRRTSANAASVLLASYVVSYTVVLLLVWTLSNNDPIHTRYVSPLYGLAIALVARVVEAAIDGGPRRLRFLPLLSVLLVVAPNLPKAVRLLSHEQPPRSLATVQEVGPRGTAWVDDLDWDRLDRIRPPRPGG